MFSLIFFPTVNELKKESVIHQKNLHPANLHLRRCVHEAQAVRISFFRVSSRSASEEFWQAACTKVVQRSHLKENGWICPRPDQIFQKYAHYIITATMPLFFVPPPAPPDRDSSEPFSILAIFLSAWFWAASYRKP